MNFHFKNLLESKFVNNLNKEANFLNRLLELKVNFDIKYGGALTSIVNFSKHYICGHCFLYFLKFY